MIILTDKYGKFEPASTGDWNSTVYYNRIKYENMPALIYNFILDDCDDFVVIEYNDKENSVSIVADKALTMAADYWLDNADIGFDTIPDWVYEHASDIEGALEDARIEQLEHESESRERRERSCGY